MIFRQKFNFAECSIYNFSRGFFGGGRGWMGGDETFPKFAESFTEILAQFHELKISKKNTTLGRGEL